MAGDRHTPAGDGPDGESAASDPAPQAPASAATGADHDYGYGTPDGGTGRAVSTPDPSAGPSPADIAPESADVPDAPQPPSGLTAPRAVLRPVPEGFPTPPPRPARPNRRPAPPAAEPPARRRGPLVIALTAAGALALAVVIGGGVLTFRALDGAAEPGAPAATGSQDGTASGPGAVEIGAVTVTEVSTEVGVRSVGSGGLAVEPEGEFVIVTFTVENRSADTLQIPQGMALVTADGTHGADSDATNAYSAESVPRDLLASGESGSFHAVFDVPIGAEVTGLEIDLESLGESGTLPLAP